MNREQCRYCGLPKANAHDYDTIPEDEGQHLCWIDYDRCLVSAEEAIDAKNNQIAELSTLAGELIAMIRVNAQRGAWTALADHEIDRHLAPWIKRLEDITQSTDRHKPTWNLIQKSYKVMMNREWYGGKFVSYAAAREWVEAQPNSKDLWIKRITEEKEEQP